MCLIVDVKKISELCIRASVGSMCLIFRRKQKKHRDSTATICAYFSHVPNFSISRGSVFNFHVLVKYVCITYDIKVLHLGGGMV